MAQSTETGKTRRVDRSERLGCGQDMPNDRSVPASRPSLKAFQGFVIVAATMVALYIGWESGFKYRFTAKRWGVVVPGQLYRSGQISKWVLERQLKTYGIAEVIDLNGIEPEDMHQANEIATVPRMGLTLHRFPLGGDGQGKISRYADALETIVAARNAGRPVLVHCSAGSQRTGGAVALYRVLIEGKSTEEARAEMQAFGWRPTRDLELVPYLNDNMKELVGLLQERGVIDRAPEPLPQFRP